MVEIVKKCSDTNLKYRSETTVKKIDRVQAVNIYFLGLEREVQRVHRVRKEVSE